MSDRRKIWTAVAVMLLMMAVLLLTGCSPRVVTVPEIHTEYIVRTDSFVKKDTVRTEKETVVRELTEEDSIMLAKYGIQLRDNERMILFLQKELEREKSVQSEAVHDTIVKCDSIPYPVEIEKPLTWWQRQKIRWGELAMTAMLALLVLAGIRIYKRK